jgi:hypothetical protein
MISLKSAIASQASKIHQYKTKEKKGTQFYFMFYF